MAASAGLFDPPQRTVLAASASAVPNNLSVWQAKRRPGKAAFAVTSMNAAVVAEADPADLGSVDGDAKRVSHWVAAGTLDPPNFSASMSVVQSCWVAVDDGTALLVVLEVGAVRVVDAFSRCLCVHKIAQRGDSGEAAAGGGGGGSAAGAAAEAVHARGACAVGGYLCVGTSTGAVVVFACGVKSGEPRVVHMADLDGAHDAAITALCGDAADAASTLMASGDASGRVVVWDVSALAPLLATGGDLPMFVLGSLESPCVSMAMSRGVLAVASFNGLVTAYEAGGARSKLLEVAAHARAPSALAVDAEGALLASVGEDGKVLVWRFPTLADPSTDLVFAADVADRMLFGAAFVSSTGALAVTAYDSNEMLLFNRRRGAGPRV